MSQQDGVVAPTMQQSLIVVKGWLSPHDLERREANSDPLYPAGGNINEVATVQMHEPTFAFRRDLHMDGSVMSKGTPVFSSFNALGRKPALKQNEDEDVRLYKLWKAKQALKRQIIFAGIAQTDTMIRNDPNNEHNRSHQGISKAMFGTATIEYNGTGTPIPGHWLIWDLPAPLFNQMVSQITGQQLTSNQKHPNKIVAEIKIADPALFKDRARYYRLQYLHEQVMYKQYRAERMVHDGRYLVGQGPLPTEQTLIATSDLEALYQEEKASFIQGLAFGIMMMRNPNAKLGTAAEALTDAQTFYNKLGAADSAVRETLILESTGHWMARLGLRGAGDQSTATFASVVGATLLHPQEMAKFRDVPTNLDKNHVASFNSIAATLLRPGTFTNNSSYRVCPEDTSDRTIHMLFQNHLVNSFTDRVEASMGHSQAISNETIGRVDGVGSTGISGTGNQVHITTGLRP